MDIRKRKWEYEGELRDHLKKKPKQVKAFYDQVGEFEDGTIATSRSSTRPFGEVQLQNDQDRATSVLDDQSTTGRNGNSPSSNANNDNDDDDNWNATSMVLKWGILGK